MSLTKPKIPLEIIRAFTTGLGDFIDPNEPIYSLLSQNFMAIEAHNLRLPVPPTPFPEKMEDWVLNADAIIPSGWRFWAASGDLYGGCHVGSVKAGTPPKLTGFSDTVQVLAGVERFNLLSTMPELAAAAFEPRVLRIGWYPLEAFWLRSTVTGVDDRFVVHSGFPPKSLDPTQSYSWAEFRKAIWGRARQAYAQALARSATAQEAQARAARIQADGAKALQDRAFREETAARAARAQAARAPVRAAVSKAETEQAPAKAPVSQPKGQKPKKH